MSQLKAHTAAACTACGEKAGGFGEAQPGPAALGLPAFWEGTGQHGSAQARGGGGGVSWLGEMTDVIPACHNSRAASGILPPKHSHKPISSGGDGSRNTGMTCRNHSEERISPWQATQTNSIPPRSCGHETRGSSLAASWPLGENTL